MGGAVRPSWELRLPSFPQRFKRIGVLARQYVMRVQHKRFHRRYGYCGFTAGGSLEKIAELTAPMHSGSIIPYSDIRDLHENK